MEVSFLFLRNVFVFSSTSFYDALIQTEFFLFLNLQKFVNVNKYSMRVKRKWLRCTVFIPYTTKKRKNYSRRISIGTQLTFLLTSFVLQGLNQPISIYQNLSDISILQSKINAVHSISTQSSFFHHVILWCVMDMCGKFLIFKRRH